MRVLVADDDAQNRDILRRLLGRLDVEVSIAKDGNEAVELFRHREAFDLILLDLAMPDLDGFGAVVAMRDIEADRGAGRTPIVALSGKDDDPSVALAGFDGFVQKPVGSAALRDALERWAQKRST